MTIGTKRLVACTNTAITTANTPLSVLQAASVVKDFDNSQVSSVINTAALPTAACNTGRMIYVENLNKYVVSDGTAWTDNLESTPQYSCTFTFTWGCNAIGQLGNGTTTSRTSPALVVGGFTDWCQVSAGNRHNLGVRSNGTAWAWGCNGYGRLGDNTLTNRSSPVSVVGGFTDWCQVSAGDSHSLGVRSNGTAWAWGINSISGKLGDGTTVSRISPVSVVGGFTDWCRVSAGYFHSLGLRTNGTLWAWGSNDFGQLGNGTTTSRTSPALVVGGFTDWCWVSAGNNFSLGVRSNGTAWAWGTNNIGQLGDGTTVNKSSPVSVVGGFTNWCQVSAGCQHSLAVRSNGTAWAWGNNNVGRLGDGTTVNKSSPVSVVGGFTNWCQVSAGCQHSLAVRSNGTAWAWGCNGQGRLGDGTLTNRTSPVSVIGGFTNWCLISAGDSHSLALRPTKGF